MAGTTLAERLFEEQQEVTRAGDRFRLSVIRLLRAELNNEAIARKAPLDAEEELAVLSRELKRRREALTDFERAGRPDLVADLQKEISILQEYLPEQLSVEELEQVVRAAIAECGAGSKRETGRVMGLLMPRLKGRADGRAVKAMVEELLE